MMYTDEQLLPLAQEIRAGKCRKGVRFAINKDAVLIDIPEYAPIEVSGLELMMNPLDEQIVDLLRARIATCMRFKG